MPDKQEKILHPDSEIIDALGGTTKVAAIFNLKKPSISKWRITGIPESRKMYLKVVYPNLFQNET